tara:strand:- start:185 stop:391 length:207 start_codon:yes stop_codon:yes gene_type:complete
MNNTFTAAIGSSALTFPVWSIFLTHGWTFFIAVLGAAVLITTLWKNILDVRIKRKEKFILELELGKRK